MAYWMLVAGLQDVTAKANRIVDANRIVSIFFNVYTGVSAVSYAFNGTDETASHLLHVALGYFIWDFQLCALFLHEMGEDMLLHAFVCTLSYVLASVGQFCCHEATMMLIMELSTPFLHIYRLAQGRQWGLKIQLYSSTAFALVYLIVRLIWATIYVGGWVVPKLWSLEHNLTNAAAFGAMVGFMLLNYYWGYKIFRAFFSK